MTKSSFKPHLKPDVFKPGLKTDASAKTKVNTKLRF